MYLFQKLQNVSVYSKLNILFQGVNFLFFLVILRLFKIEEIGVITYNESFIVLLSTVLVFGLDNYLTRYFLKFKKQHQKIIFGTVLVITFGILFTIEIIFYFLILFLGNDRIDSFFFNIPLQILILSSFVSALTQIQYSLVRIQNDLNGYIINNIIQFVIKYVTILGYCLFTVFDVNAYFTGIFIFNIICLIYLSFFINNNAKFSFRLKSIRRITRFTIPLMFNNIISIGVLFVERVIVKTLFGTSVLGFFGFASKFSNSILSFHAALKVEYVPSIVKLHLMANDDSWKKIKKLSIQNIKRIFIVSLLVTLAGIGYYSFTMPITITEIFILSIVIFQAFFNAIPLYCFPYLFIRGKTIFYLKSQFLLVITYVPLLAGFVYLFDIYGFFTSLLLRSILYLLILYIIIGKQEK